MSRRGGNILASYNQAKPARVSNDPNNLLKIIKTFPGVFEPLQNESVRVMSPCVIFWSEEHGKYRAYSDEDISITIPDAHGILARRVEEESVVRAYKVVSEKNYLFPRASDISDLAEIGTGDTDEKLERLKAGFVGRAVVGLGGVEFGDRVVDLASLALMGQEELARANHESLDILVAQNRLQQALTAEV